jgi:hypothetical protein
MAVNYFDVDLGFSIDEGTIVVTYGNGTGSLSGVTTTDLPLGSLFIDNATGNVYNRTANTNDDVTDWDLQASQDYVASQLATQVSWREPVEVRDNTTTTTAAMNALGTASNPATVDGESITDGERVLFSALTDGGGKNVYIYDQAAGTFTEDTNLETDGDTVYVKTGTDAGTRYTYNGTDWVLTDLSSSDELGFIRTFIGKDAVGSNDPAYSSTNVVTNAPVMSLETAIGALDGAFGNRTYTNDHVVTDSETITASIDALDTALGNGDITNDGGNWALTDDLTWGTASPGGTLDLTGALNDLNAAIGDRTYTNDNYVTDGQSIAASIDALDVAIGNIAEVRVAATGASLSSTIVDSFAHNSDPTEVRWMILIRDPSSSPDDVEALEVHGLSDGVSDADHTVYGKLKVGGGKVSGLVIDVTTDGTNVNLVLTASNACDYVIKRVHSLSFTP